MCFFLIQLYIIRLEIINDVFCVYSGAVANLIKFRAENESKYLSSSLSIFEKLHVKNMFKQFHVAHLFRLSNVASDHTETRDSIASEKG